MKNRHLPLFILLVIQPLLSHCQQSMLPTKLSSDTIQIVELPAQWYVGVRKSLSTEEPAAISKFIGPAYGQIMEQLGPQGIKPLGPPMTHTYNYTEDSIDIEAAFPVGEEANVNEPVIC